MSDLATRSEASRKGHVSRKRMVAARAEIVRADLSPAEVERRVAAIGARVLDGAPERGSAPVDGDIRTILARLRARAAS